LDGNTIREKGRKKIKHNKKLWEELIAYIPLI
jgi:hypothetical protein